jgi:hypothetical protein
MHIDERQNGVLASPRQRFRLAHLMLYGQLDEMSLVLGLQRSGRTTKRHHCRLPYRVHSFLG